MKKVIVNWINFINLVGFALIFGVVGMGLFFAMFVLGGKILYSLWASYPISIILWYLLCKDYKLTKEIDVRKRR